MRWKIEGFDSDVPTGFSREESGSEATVKLLLERLVARHLAADEIVDATIGSAKLLFVNRDKREGEPIQLMTVGNPYYVAVEVRNAKRA